MDINNTIINYEDIKELFEELKSYNIYGYIVGGQAYKYYYNDINDYTIDYDIEIYINNKQLNKLETFINIYKCIKNLHNKCKKYINNLNNLQTFDYNKNYKKIYVPYKLIKAKSQYYNYNIICDIQIDDIINTYADIAIIYTPELEELKNNITDLYYISKKSFNKKIMKYYDDLCMYEKKYYDKITKVKSRINFINNINSVSIK